MKHSSHDWKKYVREHLPSLGLSAERELEIVEELAVHFEAAYDAALLAGATEEQARARALAQISDWRLMESELTRSERKVGRSVANQSRMIEDKLLETKSRYTPAVSLGSAIQDVRYAFRTLKKNPGFTIVAVITLALGIGANTAIFSVVNAVLLRPLPYSAPDRLVTLRETNPLQADRRINLSYPALLDVQDQSRAFEQIAGLRNEQFTLTGQGEPVHIQAALVSPNLFAVLNVKPQPGRTMVPEENQPGAPPVTVVSHGFWQRRFAGDPELVGKTITLDDHRVTVIGVMPEGFAFFDQDIEVWLPLGLVADQDLMKNRAVHTIAALGRLKPEATLGQAQAEIETIAAGIQQRDPAADPGHSMTLVPLHEAIVGNVRSALLVLLGVVGLVLLIACVNVANLMLARGTARHKEMAIRAALGAGRWQLIRQLLSESFLLSAIGGIVGLLLALWGTAQLSSDLINFVPRAEEIRIDSLVLGFTMATSVLTGLAFGLVPAIQTSKTKLQGGLKEGGRTSAGGSGARRAHKSLVVAEVALSLVLLVGAGLMVKSFWRLTTIDPGFQTDNLLTLRVSLPESKYPDVPQVVAFYRQLPARLQALPGVVSVSAVNSLPISGGDSDGQLTIEGRPFPKGEAPGASYRRILPNYFQTMGIPLEQGREFTDRDQGQEPKVVIVNAEMARRYWRNESPLGHRIKVGPAENEPWLTIVGVVGDVRNVGLGTDPLLATYEPHPQRPWSTMNLAVRTNVDPTNLIETVRAELRTQEPDLVIDRIDTMGERIYGSVAGPRFNMLLMAIFAVVALILTIIGTYGVMSYSVGQRAHEVGIRMAMGAKRGDIFRLVIGQGALLALVGVAIGAGGAFVLSRYLESLLFGITATDPATYLIVSLLLLFVALLACYIPARRATRIDPIEALRYE